MAPAVADPPLELVNGTVVDRHPDIVTGRAVGEPQAVVYLMFAPGDDWPSIAAKVTEHLRAAVVVVVLAEPNQLFMIVEHDKCPRLYGPGYELALPQVFPHVRVSAGIVPSSNRKASGTT